MASSGMSNNSDDVKLTVAGLRAADVAEQNYGPRSRFLVLRDADDKHFFTMIGDKLCLSFDDMHVVILPRHWPVKLLVRA